MCNIVEQIKFSDLDIDIPVTQSTKIKQNLYTASLLKDDKRQIHTAGVYFYKDIPAYKQMSILDYKTMEEKQFQKIDLLNNHVLDDITLEEYNTILNCIENDDIDWLELQEMKSPYQLAKYDNILKDFNVSSVMDIAIILGLIRPGSKHNYSKMKKVMKYKKSTILDTLKKNEYDILKDTYGIPIFQDQFRKLNIDDGAYRYKKPHAIGYAYVLLIDFLKNSIKT